MLEIQKKLSNSFYAMLALPATAVGFALSTQIAALSWILNKKFGLNIHEVSFVWLAGPLAGIFGQVIVGMISDNVWFLGGRRRPFIMIGGIVGALMFLAFTTNWSYFRSHRYYKHNFNCICNCAAFRFIG